MSRAFFCDFRRAAFRPAFLSAVLVTFFLCFLEDAYIDSSTMRAYTVFEAACTFPRSFFEKNPGFCSVIIWRDALSGYAAMFLPVLASFPFVCSQCAERSSGNVRFQLVRTGKWSFYASKFASAVLSGGACIALGVILFGIFCALFFPSPASYPEGVLAMQSYEGLFPEVAKKLASAFLYGCANTLLAFFMLSFCRNRYIVLCVPFMARFIQDTAIRKAEMASADPDVYWKLAPFASNAPSRIPYMGAGGAMIESVAVLAAAAALSFAGYVLASERRMDRGD